METETATIFSALCSFFLAHKGEIASRVIASATYDGLKNTLKFSGLKKRIQRFFKRDRDADRYIAEICDKEARNPSKPIRDLEDAFEEITGDSFNPEIFDLVKEWIMENEKDLVIVSKMTFTNQGGFNIGTQNAGQNIINIQGDFHAPKKDE